MQRRSVPYALAGVVLLTCAASADDFGGGHGQGSSVQLGPRPFYLVDGLDEGPLKHRLEQCENGPFRRTDFSIGHRGAALQFPEHTKESYEAGARKGAGIVECDVTFTKDGELVCRHDECDLHTTTNIVTTPLNGKCTVPWSGPNSTRSAARATSRSPSSDAEGQDGCERSVRHDGRRRYLGGTACWRTDLYTGRGTLVTLRREHRAEQEATA